VRADVAAAFGSARFLASGFRAQGSLDSGEYDLVVFARSTVSGTFNNLQVVRVRVN
jgi:hypothetical protein